MLNFEINFSRAGSGTGLAKSAFKGRQYGFAIFSLHCTVDQ